MLYDIQKGSSTDTYIEIEPRGNKTVVWLNLNHQFFQKVYDKLKEINELAEGSVDPDKSKLVDLASQLKTDIDNLIISYTDSQNSLAKHYEGDQDLSNEMYDAIELLMINWSLCLRKLYRKSS